MYYVTSRDCDLPAQTPTEAEASAVESMGLIESARERLRLVLGYQVDATTVSDVAMALSLLDDAAASAANLVETLGARRADADRVADMAAIPPPERAAALLAAVRQRRDEYGDLANSDADLLRDALLLAADRLNDLEAAPVAQPGPAVAT